MRIWRQKLSSFSREGTTLFGNPLSLYLALALIPSDTNEEKFHVSSCRAPGWLWLLVPP